MASLNVNDKAVIDLTAKLERMHKSAFPSAVRNTLNDAAFETRKLLPTVGARQFKYQRNKSFLKTFSTVDKAKGFNVRQMHSIVGIDATRDRQLAENLESQEFGGTVKGDKIVAHDDARTSQSKAKRVSRRNAKDKVKAHNATRAYKAHRGTRNSKFVSAVMSTAKSGKKHMLLSNGSRGMIYEIKNVSQNRKTRKINFKIKKLYSIRNKNTSNVKAVHFMRASANSASKGINEMYKKNAEFQFKKSLRN